MTVHLSIAEVDVFLGNIWHGVCNINLCLINFEKILLINTNIYNAYFSLSGVLPDCGDKRNTVQQLRRFKAKRCLPVGALLFCVKKVKCRQVEVV